MDRPFKKLSEGQLLASLKRIIRAKIKREFPEEQICLFLSGGTDSTLVGLVAQEIGKKVTAISYQVRGIENWDHSQAERTARTCGWDFHTAIIEVANIKSKFIELMEQDGCSIKTEVECMLPFKEMFLKATSLGYRKALTGFNNPIPDGRNDSIAIKRDNKAFWEETLRTADLPDSPATAKMCSYAEENGFRIVSPLGQRKIVEHLYGLTDKQLNSPYRKKHWKLMFEKEFRDLGLLRTKTKFGLQTGGEIQAVFAPLLDDPDINYRNFTKGNTTIRLSSLYKAWAERVKKTSNLKSENEKSSRFNTKILCYTLKDVNAAAANKLFSVVSTFAGGGGSSTGYKLAGGDVIFVNEFIPAAIATYNLNFPGTPVVSADIRRINRSKEHVEELFQRYGIAKGELDVLDGSPPCSTFSAASAGKGKDKIERKNVQYSDTTQNRVGMLIHDYVFMANVMQPKVCVIENVPRIKSADVFKYALERLRRWGYLVNFRKLVATDFGVPQKRERLFVIAVRPDIARKVGLRTDEDILQVFPEPSSNPLSIRMALSGLQTDHQERDMLLTLARQGSSYELIKKLPFNPAKPTGMAEVAPGWTSDFNLVRGAWDLPSPTITATGASGRGGILHPNENRSFTLAELKRLTSLPDDFKLAGTFAQKAERIGRMVPPLMTKAIAQSIYNNVLLRSR